MMARIAWVLLLGVAVANAASDKLSESPFGKTLWGGINTAMGVVNTAGVLRLNYSVEGTRELKLMGIRLNLEHRLGTTLDGAACSDWRFGGLQTSLVPVGREKIRWQSLGGAAVTFDRAGIGPALQKIGAAGWRVRLVGRGEYEIRSLDGRAWRYRDGLLVAMHHPSLGGVEVSQQGTWIRRLRLPGSTFSLLEVDYDEAMRPTRIALGGDAEHRFTWDDEGKLTTWIRPNGIVVEFSYVDGLVVALRETEKPERRFSWQLNGGYERGDTRWRYPVHLSRADGDNYGYALTSRGFVLSRGAEASAKRVVTIFNPRLFRLEQQTADRTLVVHFHQTGEIAGRVDYIESAKGDRLESYGYDAEGRLVEVVHPGQSTRRLMYDDIGRLIGYEESVGGEP